VRYSAYGVIAYPATVQLIGDCAYPLVRCTNRRVYYGTDARDVTAIRGEHHPVLVAVADSPERLLATCLPDRVLIRPMGERARAIVIKPGGDAGLTCTCARGRFIGASGRDGKIFTFNVSVNTKMQAING
jgi:hypothetical protein